MSVAWQNELINMTSIKPQIFIKSILEHPELLKLSLRSLFYFTYPVLLPSFQSNYYQVIVTVQTLKQNFVGCLQFWQGKHHQKLFYYAVLHQSMSPFQALYGHKTNAICIWLSFLYFNDCILQSVSWITAESAICQNSRHRITKRENKQQNKLTKKPHTLQGTASDPPKYSSSISNIKWPQGAKGKGGKVIVHAVSCFWTHWGQV